MWVVEEAADEVGQQSVQGGEGRNSWALVVPARPTRSCLILSTPERAEAKFAFIDGYAPKKHAPADGKNRFPVTYMCIQLGVSRSGYYAWKNRGVSQ